MMTAAAVLGTACLAGAGAATGTAATAVASAAAQGGTWGTAAEIPGSNRLNHGGQASIGTVSCASATNCGAGGSYTSGFSSTAPIIQAFVVNKTANIWRGAQEVPGTAALNTGGNAKINSVSCPAPGDCSAGGYYTDASSGHQQALVATETGGTWGNAKEIPGSGALNAGGAARIDSVSCGAAGDCSAGGQYASKTVDGISTVQAFVVNETGGTWGKAAEVPGTAALNGGGYATVNSVSCPSAGNCSAGGFYLDASFDTQAFVVSESGGTWGSAEEIPGSAALDQHAPGAVTDSVSCGAPGDCSASGSYTDSAGAQQAFVADQSAGTWGSAEEVPGTGALNGGGQASAQSVSCAASGLCNAVGQYQNVRLNTQVFAVSQS